MKPAHEEQAKMMKAKAVYMKLEEMVEENQISSGMTTSVNDRYTYLTPERRARISTVNIWFYSK